MYTRLRWLAAIFLFVCGSVMGQASPPVVVLHTQPHVFTINPGGDIYVNYRFRASAPTVRSNRVFVHFLDANGWIIFQDDHQPPTATTQWYGDIAYERYLKVPAHVAAGHYRIAVGLYHPQTGTRTAMSTLADADSTEPAYTAEERPQSSRYVVGEVYITTKQIVEAPFACNGNDVTLPLRRAFANLVSGQVLKLPFGQCQYSSISGVNAMRLDGRTDVEVVGQGAPSTRLVATDKMRSGLIVSGSSKVLLRDFRIDVARPPGLDERTGDPNATGVYVENSANVELRQLALVNPLAQGVSFYRARDSRATRNFVKRSAADGIHAAGPSSNMTLDNNETFDTGDDAVSSIGYSAGLYAGPNENVSIHGNRIRFRDVKWGSGVAVEGTAVAKVLNNYIERSGSSGIRIASISGYQDVRGERLTFVTGSATAVEVSGNQLVDVETRTDLVQGAIHIAAMSGDVSDVRVSGNTISSTSSAGTTNDAIRIVGTLAQSGNYYIRNTTIWSNTINNASPGVLGDWCVAIPTPTAINVVVNRNPQGQLAPNVYNNTGTTSRSVGTRNCTYDPGQ